MLEEITHKCELARFALQRSLSVGGGKNYFLLSSHFSMCSCSFQWNALSLTTPWVLHNLISLDKRKISGRKPLHTKLSGLDSKLSICQSMHATIWLDWKFAERVKNGNKLKVLTLQILNQQRKGKSLRSTCIGTP